MFNNKQRKNIIYSIGIVAVLGLLAGMIYLNVEYFTWEGLMGAITAYGGIAFLILKFITLFITTNRTLRKAQPHITPVVTPIPQTYTFNFESEKAFLKQTETALIKDIRTELNKKIFAELRIEAIKQLCLKNNCRVSKSVLDVLKRNVMIENKINEIKKIIN